MSEIRKVCQRHFEVVLVDEFRTTAVSASHCLPDTSDRLLRPVFSDATQKQVRGLMGCSLVHP
ncbi:MAG: hypothetical protein ACT6UU_25030, partial [Hydrogenophaga sp.]|uniref:hypothetical protein n=1 Tax=Hydrogenophaga sp. TaxID=1904254 RepID=UPI00403564BF